MSRKSVSIIYHFFPHYRRAVLRALAASERYAFSFWGSKEPIEGIEPFRGDDLVDVHPIRCAPRGRGFGLAGFWPAVFGRDVDCVILLGNPNILATWAAALVARALGKKVFFWTHGWLHPEGWLKSRVRNAYFGLAHRVLVYGDRALRLATSGGFNPAKVRVIYNSLDWAAAQEALAELRLSRAAELRAEATDRPDLPLLICTARLTSACRFDLLLHALKELKEQGRETSLILVGDGPAREALQRLAKKNNLRVDFRGAIYDENIIARLVYTSDLTVSPGKVGLTAIHSLSYGTPVITHGNLNAQMPEVEAVSPGLNGDFFDEGDWRDLARTISKWLDSSRDREALRIDCQRPIRERYNPEVQRHLIEAALDEVLL